MALQRRHWWDSALRHRLEGTYLQCLKPAVFRGEGHATYPSLPSLMADHLLQLAQLAKGEAELSQCVFLEKHQELYQRPLLL